MIRAKSVRLSSESDVVAYVFREGDGATSQDWVCLRSLGAAADRAWLECWSSKGADGVNVPDLLAALTEVIREHLRQGPLGSYLEGVHFFPGWETWGGAIPQPIARYAPAEVAANSEDPVEISEFSLDR
jgi:hypothetical protein